MKIPMSFAVQFDEHGDPTIIGKPHDALTFRRELHNSDKHIKLQGGALGVGIVEVVEIQPCANCNKPNLDGHIEDYTKEKGYA